MALVLKVLLCVWTLSNCAQTHATFSGPGRVGRSFLHNEILYSIPFTQAIPATFLATKASKIGLHEAGRFQFSNLISEVSAFWGLPPVNLKKASGEARQ